LRVSPEAQLKAIGGASCAIAGPAMSATTAIAAIIPVRIFESPEVQK
jgi:hypothetical protein